MCMLFPINTPTLYMLIIYCLLCLRDFFCGERWSRYRKCVLVWLCQTQQITLLPDEGYSCYICCIPFRFLDMLIPFRAIFKYMIRIEIKKLPLSTEGHQIKFHIPVETEFSGRSYIYSYTHS